MTTDKELETHEVNGEKFVTVKGSPYSKGYTAGIIKGLELAVARIQIMRDSQAQAAKYTDSSFAHERLTAYDWAMNNLKHEIDKLEKERGG